jgi:hypothetical protein
MIITALPHAAAVLLVCCCCCIYYFAKAQIKKAHNSLHKEEGKGKQCHTRGVEDPIRDRYTEILSMEDT